MFTLDLKGKKTYFSSPIVMGIINTTPDSFYVNSSKQSITAALHQTEKMLTEGATIIDIGGQSTKPNSTLISIDEELKRVIPIIEAIHLQFPQANISIDTFNAIVAKNAVDAGATMVNDIGGGTLDINMLSTIAQLNVPYVCMHIKGTPQTMQQQSNYTHIIEEIKAYFIDKIAQCNLLNFNKLIVDIGFGFAKTTEQNFELVNNLHQFSTLQKPLLLGVSRKSSIYKTLGITANEALNGTTVINTIGLLKGANILRVHDVKEAVEAIKLCRYFNVN